MNKIREIPPTASVYADRSVDFATDFGYFEICPICERGELGWFRDDGYVGVCGCGAAFDDGVYVEHREPWAMDVLIQADIDKTDHKHRGKVPEFEQPYWSVVGTPRRTMPGWRVLFSSGGRVYAESRISSLDDGKIWFDPLVGVDRPVPVDPPSRGYVYVVPSERRRVSGVVQSSLGDF